MWLLEYLKKNYALQAQLYKIYKGSVIVSAELKEGRET